MYLCWKSIALVYIIIVYITNNLLKWCCLYKGLCMTSLVRGTCKPTLQVPMLHQVYACMILPVYHVYRYINLCMHYALVVSMPEGVLMC